MNTFVEQRRKVFSALRGRPEDLAQMGRYRMVFDGRALTTWARSACEARSQFAYQIYKIMRHRWALGECHRWIAEQQPEIKLVAGDN